MLSSLEKLGFILGVFLLLENGLDLATRPTHVGRDQELTGGGPHGGGMCETGGGRYIDHMSVVGQGGFREAGVRLELRVRHTPTHTTTLQT